MHQGKTIVIHDDNGDETHLPAKWEICSSCNGDGTRDAWSGGMTASEMDEHGPDFMEDYVAGHYSVPCYECNGSGKTLTGDTDRMTSKQERLYQNHLDAEAYLQHIENMERRQMGDY